MAEFVVVLENIRSAYNVGSVLRTVDALGSHYSVWGVGFTPFPDNAKVKKTSLGAEQYVEWRWFPTIEELFTELRAQKFTIYGVECIEPSIDYTRQSYTSRSAFIFGNEVRGVSDYVVTQADMLISIPMTGHKESLNVASTVGIVMFEVNRQQRL